MSVMDNQKDITVYKGQNMSIKDMSFIKSRLEKLATAVFMITNYIDSTEPLRTNLRKLVLDIISERQDDLNDLSDRVDRVLSVIKIGNTVGLISETSAQILISEFEKLKNSLEINLPDTLKSIFEIPDVQRRETPPPNLPLTKGEVPKPARPAGGAEGVIPPLIRGGREGLKTSSFRQKILDFIKEKGSVSVKDVATVVTDCSEKTIQRELAFLVDQSVLHRVGQKRWARYLLVSF